MRSQSACNMSRTVWVLLLSAALVLRVVVAGKKDKPAYCGACKAVVDELQYSIKSEDPMKTLQTGSFRVDSHGRQTGVRKKRYAGSETHLTELLEKVCDLMSNYGVTTDPTTGEKGYMRINSRAGETITISNVNFSSDGARELSNACSYFISEYEDDIIEVFQDDVQDAERELCYDVTGYCRGSSERTEL